jgi:hypothetical protein
MVYFATRFDSRRRASSTTSRTIAAGFISHSDGAAFFLHVSVRMIEPGMPAGRLLQFSNDRALFSVHQRFSVGAITLIEPDCPGGVLVYNLFSVRSGRF